MVKGKDRTFKDWVSWLFWMVVLWLLGVAIIIGVIWVLDYARTYV